MPTDDYTLPLDTAETVFRGSDLTLLSYGTPLYSVETALAMLANPPESIAHAIPAGVRSASVEVLDLRTLLPWDMPSIEDSVKRTRRCVVVHEAGRIGGLGADMAAEIQERCFLRLEAPVRRVTGWECVQMPCMK